MVYQNHNLENVNSVEKMDGHQDPPGSRHLSRCMINGIIPPF
jgi:hypothetical protein